MSRWMKRVFMRLSSRRAQRSKKATKHEKPLLGLIRKHKSARLRYQIWREHARVPQSCPQSHPHPSRSPPSSPCPSSEVALIIISIETHLRGIKASEDGMARLLRARGQPLTLVLAVPIGSRSFRRTVKEFCRRIENVAKVLTKSSSDRRLRMYCRTLWRSKTKLVRLIFSTVVLHRQL